MNMCVTVILYLFLTPIELEVDRIHSNLGPFPDWRLHKLAKRFGPLRPHPLQCPLFTQRKRDK